MKFYRYEESLFVEDQVKVIERLFVSIKETIHGFCIIREFNYRTGIPSRPRWISKTSRKRYAYPTKNEALMSFLARKRMQICTLENQILRASTARVIASTMLKELEDVPQTI